MVVYSLLGACLSNETLSDMDMATMSDEFDLFFGASFDGVRCCHATAGSRMPCMSADLLYLPFSHPSASACRMVASGEAA